MELKTPFPNELSWKIFLDRYTQKDIDRRFVVGDLAVVLVEPHPKWPKKDIGRVTAIRPDGQLDLELLTGPEKGTVVVRKPLDCDRPLETSLEEVAARIASGVAAVEPEGARAAVAASFTEEIAHLRLVPGGRIWAGAGTGKQLTYFNCVAYETPIHTRDGVRPIGTLSGPVDILTEGGQFRTAVFGSYGIQRLYRVVLENGDVLYATAGHEWLAATTGSRTETVTTLDLPGRDIPIEPPVKPALDPAGVEDGLAWGGPNGGWARRASLDGLAGRSPAYWRGFIAGLIRHLGTIAPDGTVLLAIPDEALRDVVHHECVRAGFMAAPLSALRRVSNSDVAMAGDGALAIYPQSVVLDDLLWPVHRRQFAAEPPLRGFVRVREVVATERVEEVYCCNEPETHTMVVGAGYLTRQCYVVPNPRDSREGIVETLGQMIEIMSRGGGVGINVSSLRPSRAAVRGVNGRSSGAVSWMDLYSRATGLVEQGGSRRGALMLQIEDWHPDLWRFIDVKKTPGMVENANISVRVSDAFMQAVKNDGDWDLVFPDTTDPDYDTLWDGNLETWRALGKPIIVYETHKAQRIWQEIIKGAWEAAEPGIVFDERHEKESNSWYFNPLVCTNPCVTGDTLIPTSDGLCRAQDLAAAHGGLDVLVDGRFGGPSLAPVARVFPTGVKPVVTVETVEGYRVRTTRDHRFYSDARGWVAAGDLEPGEAIRLANRGGAFGHLGTLEDGQAMGWLVAAAAAATRSAPAPGPSSGFPWSPGRARYGTALLETLTPSLAEAKLREFLPENGPDPRHLHVPDTILQGTQAAQTGFLQALAEANGIVSYLRTPAQGYLRIRHDSESLLLDVQRLLLNLGMQSRFYPHREGVPELRGGERPVRRAGVHQLVIRGASLERFALRIGALSPVRLGQLNRALADQSSDRPEERWTARVKRVADDGIEPVFDLTEPRTHSFVANGLVVHNCAEQPLPAWGVCTLGHINLAAMYDARTHDVDWQQLRRTIEISVRFLDNIVDATPYFFEENRRNQERERRIGMGTLGLGELLIRLGLRYGSPESVTFIDKLYAFIATESYRYDVALAQEKGPFPAFDADRYLDSGFMRRMPDEIRALIAQHGVRNVTILTQAPTGTVGTLVGTSTGIEPFYALTYFRQSRLGFDEQYVPVAQEWVEQHPGETLPPYFVGAMDLTPEEHIYVQAAIQRWTDSSISKTANAPSSYTVEDTARLYEMAYDLGCKGVTIYRDKSRSEQVLHLTDEREPSEEPAAEAPLRQFPAQVEVYPVPSQVSGRTYRRETPAGTARVVINEVDSDPFEVFLLLGRAGSEIQSFMEALGRVISLYLRSSGDLTPRHRLQLAADQLKGIGGAHQMGFGSDRVLSVVDAIGLVLDRHLNPDKSTAPLLELVDPPSQTAGGQGPKLDLCPQCESPTLIYEEGCAHCTACGYSKC